jgi:hypothetical protein
MIATAVSEDGQTASVTVHYSVVRVVGTVVVAEFPARSPVLDRPYPVLPPQLTVAGGTATFFSGVRVYCGPFGQPCMVTVTVTTTVHGRRVKISARRTRLEPDTTLVPKLKVALSKLRHRLHGRSVKVRIRVAIGRKGTAKQTKTVKLKVKLR